MTGWWLWIIGADGASVPSDAQWQWTWLNNPGSWWLLLGLALLGLGIYGVFWLYRRELETCPPRVRLVLAMIRSFVLVLLAIIFLSPALAISQKRVIEPYVAVLVDDSLSMSVRDRYDPQQAQKIAGSLGQDAAAIQNDPPTRAQLVHQLLNHPSSGLLASLRAHGHVKVMSFSHQVQHRALLPSLRPGAAALVPATAPAGGGVDAGLLQTINPTGVSTNTSQAIRQALRSLANVPVSALVVLSDGQVTEGGDPRQAADLCAAQHVPIFTVGVGDSRQPRRLRLADVYYRDTVWRDDPFQIEATLEAYGLDSSTLQVELLESSLDQSKNPPENPPENTPDNPPNVAGGFSSPESAVTNAPGVVVARMEVPWAGQSQKTVTLEHTPRQVGSFVYTLRVQPIDGGAIEPQSQSFAVTVLGEKARVLLIAGSPSWEYQLVKGVLQRDKTINLSCWLQSLDADMMQEGNTLIDRLPDKPEELFKYDLVMMLDPDPTPAHRPLELGPAFMEMLKKLVGEHSGALFYQAGPAYTSRLFSLSATQGLRDLLPVQMGDFGAADVEGLVAAYTKGWSVRVTAEGVDHAILRLGDEAQPTRSRWEGMPSIYWTYPIDAIKPGARTLLEFGDPNLRSRDGARPLLVAGMYGSGHTVFMGFDSTWRWRSVGHDAEYFDRYWVQLVRFLIEGKRMGDQRRGQITLDRTQYSVGSPVQVRARLYDAQYAPLTMPVVVATINPGRANAQPLELRAVPDRPGRYEATFVARQLGINELRLDLPTAAGALPSSLQRTFTVQVPRVEFADTRLDQATLRDLAQRSGGEYFDLDQAGRLFQVIPDRRQTLVTRQKPLDLWDNLPVLVLLAGLLSTEWALRKKYKLL